MPTQRVLIGLAAILIATAANLLWTLSPDHYYFADDWAWLYRAAFFTHAQLADWLPQQPYNDRPVGAAFIKLLYDSFGPNPAVHHGILLTLHLLNTLLVWRLASLWLKDTWIAAAAALLFANWTPALTAVTWLAAIFDLLGCTLVLLSVLAYVHSTWKARIASAALFFLALRTKEFAITVPAILLLWELTRNSWRQVPAIAGRLAAHLAIAVIVGGKYAWLMRTGTILEPGGPYTPVYTPAVFVAGLSRYTHLLAGLPAAGFAVAAAILALRRQWTALAAAGGFVLLLLPVIFLPNRSDALYLYAPSAFFWIAAAGLSPPTGRTALAAIAIAITVWQASGPMRRLERVVLTRSAPFGQSAADLKRLHPTLPAASHLFIEGLPEYLNLFDYGPCYAVKVLYRDDSLRCTIYQPADALKAAYDAAPAPKHYLGYSTGKLTTLDPAAAPILPPDASTITQRAFAEPTAIETQLAPSLPNGDFTIEFIARFAARGSPLGTLLTDQDPRARRGITIQRQLSGDAVLECLIGEGGEWRVIGQWTPPPDGEVHLALTRAGRVFAGFLDGREVFRAESAAVEPSGLPLMLGNLAPGGPRPSGALIREVRLSRKPML